MDVNYSYEVLPEEEDSNLDNQQKCTYNEIFELVGFGKWHILLLFQCGWANASDAIEIMCISFTMSSMHQSLNLPSEKLTSLTVALFLGMMVGGYLWGSLADRFGRRKIIIQSLIVNSVFGAASAFGKNLWVMVFLRFLSGVGAGGSLPVCFSYFSEFQQTSRRGAMITALATFWMAGNCIASGLAWMILPSSNLIPISPYGETWRLFLIICALPSFTSSLMFCLMPESPLFLIKNGQPVEAFKVLNKIYTWNHGSNSKMPFTSIDDENIKKRFSKPVGIVRILFNILQTIKTQFTDMFSSHQQSCKNSLLLSWVAFCISFTYGLAMWVPTLIERSVHFGSPCNTTKIEHSQNQDLSSADTYIDVFIGSAAQLPSNLLAFKIIDKVGAKPLLVIGFLLSSFSSICFWFVKTKLQTVFVNALFNSATTIVWDAFDVIIPELYSTRVRASANGFLSVCCRIAALTGNAVMGSFIDSSCTIPLLTFCFVLLSGAFSSFFLPNTRGVDLH